ncbi:MAG: ATP-binding protein [Kofleriaceae bacterium]
MASPKPPWEGIFASISDRHYRVTDHVFLWLMIAQWLVTAGVQRGVGFEAVIAVVPIAAIVMWPGHALTRHTIAVAQIAWSVVLMHALGRPADIQICGSLAFLAFYRDWKVLVTATACALIATANDPAQLLAFGAWWAFEDTVLIRSCVRARTEMVDAAMREATLQQTARTVQRKVENRTHALQQSAERYRALVENTEAIPFEYDIVARRYRYLAPQAEKVFDAKLEDLKIGIALHDDDRERVEAALEGFVRGERAPNEPIDYRLATSARVVHVRTFFSSLVGERLRGIMLDITHQVSLEGELRQAQKLESVGRLAAGVAHEINTPVQFISDSMSFAKDAVGDLIELVERQQTALEATGDAEAIRRATEACEHADLSYLREHLPAAVTRASEGAERVATIVRSMKMFAHPAQSARSLVDLRQSIESALVIAAGEYKHVADVERALDDLPPVMCFAGELHQAILNIIVNAAHAVGDAVAGTDRRGTIRIGLTSTAGAVVITIADTGTGIPEHARARIFDQFYTTKPVGKGTGQGLALAHAIIVDKHHGSLRFDTELGLGTTFTLSIPVGVPAALAA